MQTLKVMGCVVGAIIIASTVQAKMVEQNVLDGKDYVKVAIPEGYDLIPHEEMYPGFDQCIADNRDKYNVGEICSEKATAYWAQAYLDACEAALASCKDNAQCRKNLQKTIDDWQTWLDKEQDTLSRNFTYGAVEPLTRDIITEYLKMQTKVLKQIAEYGSYENVDYDEEDM